MIRKAATAGLIATGVLFAVSAVARAGSGAPDPAAFHDDMRALWAEHATWTRLYIVNALADLPGKAATAHRLLQNQTDIGNAIMPFYGDEAGRNLTELLKDHILIAASFIDAAKAGDTAKQDAAAQRWSANADRIASFLSQTNAKNWPLPEMTAMMHEHLDLTTVEVLAGLKSDWKADIAAYDAVSAQVMTIADVLSDGIVKQYPGRFKKT